MDNAIDLRGRAAPSLTSAAVVREYRPAVVRYLCRLCGDAALAEDLAQETFLRVHEHLADLRDPAALEGWIYRVATNACYDRFRELHREMPMRPDAADDPDEASLRPDQLADQHEMSVCVQRFLARLPRSYRAVLILHDLQGLRDPEIAAALGEPLAAVKMRLHRARGKLKAVLSAGCQFTRDERGVLVCHPSPPHSA